MKLTIIGCSGSMSGPKSAASSYLIQATGNDPRTGNPRVWSVVFDMGPGSFGQLWNHLDPKELDAVVFSHGHADHMADIISLEVYNRWNPSGPVPPISVYGPAGIGCRTAQIDGWATEQEMSDVFDFRALEDQVSFSVGPMKITPFAARHSVPTFGYRIEAPAESVESEPVIFAYTGDTDTCDSILQMAQGANLLLSEAAFTKSVAVRGIHMDGVRAGELATSANVGQLVITHIQPWTDPETVLAEVRTTWGGPLAAARPGEEYFL